MTLNECIPKFLVYSKITVKLSDTHQHFKMLLKFNPKLPWTSWLSNKICSLLNNSHKRLLNFIPFTTKVESEHFYFFSSYNNFTMEH